MGARCVANPFSPQFQSRLPSSTHGFGKPNSWKSLSCSRRGIFLCQSQTRSSLLQHSRSNPLLLIGKFDLRIDLNRQWNIDDANRFFSTYPKDTFDYIEEPGKSISDLFHFEHSVAVDESLREVSFDSLVAIPNLKALIVKPMLLQGGLKQLKIIQQKADHHGLKLILSSSFESGLGLNSLLQLTKHLGLSSVMGFDTYRYFKEDLLQTPLVFNQGSFYSQSNPLLQLHHLCSVQ